MKTPKKVFVVTYDGSFFTVCSTRKLAESLSARLEKHRFKIHEGSIDSVFSSKPPEYKFYLISLRFSGTVIEAFELSAMYWSSEFWISDSKHIQFRIWEVSKNAAIKRAKEKRNYLKNRKEGDSDYWVDKRGIPSSKSEIIYSYEEQPAMFIPR